MRKMILWGLAVVFLLGMPSFLSAAEKKSEPEQINSKTFAGLTWRNIGPATTSGRVSDIAIHPRDPRIWYVAAGSGGVWKTINAGTTWTPIFDEQSSYSIGCITIDPVNPDIIWVGTGENVSGRHVGFGDGVYKSLNGGQTWQNMGLTHSEHISRILVSPEDSTIIYVAAEGPLWAAGGERGIYKSTDGGQNWQLSLFITPDTGVTSMEFEPGNPAILYAATYQRRRSVAAFLAGGPESGIYKSTDNGTMWRKLTVGLPKGHMGRIGLAVSPQKPNVVYATIEANKEERGFYRSADRGESWEKRNSFISNAGTGPHYYQEIFADPHVFDRVYQMEVWIHVTEDGGKTFQKLGERTKHSDSHALAFDLVGHNPDYLLVGCDGGVYQTWDRGKTWQYFANLPITQFYKLALDNVLPFYNIHGGAQDNGSQMGPSRTLNINGIPNSDWFTTGGADGYGCVIDPKDNNIIYCQWQEGYLLRYDKRSGELVDIRPYPGIGEETPRWNWDAPILLSPFSSTRLYYGAQRLYRSENRGDSWTPISPDLTRGIFRLDQKIMGRTWGADALWDHSAMSYFSTLTALAESPLQEGLIYAGSDDGLIHITEDGGKTWRKTEKLPGVPEYYFVNDIQASLFEANTVFVAIDNHKNGDFKPYLLKSTDRGKTWTSMAGDLPPRHFVWSITQDHKKADLFFIGTELGIFFTVDGGRHWVKFSGRMPVISFRDIEIQRREDDLVGASFGRGFFVLDDYSCLRTVNENILAQDSVLFPVKKALMYIQRRPYDLVDKAFFGDSFYLAPNPPFGAVFTYYLKDSLKTRKQQRQEQEKELLEAGKGVLFPSWDVLKQELQEAKPAVIITITDAEGRVVRRLTGSTEAGIHRVAWDLRYPAINPVQLEVPKDSEPWDMAPQGPLVVPGTFQVTLAKDVDGVITPLSAPRSFEVESLGLASLPAKDRTELLAFQRKAGALQRAVMGSGRVVDESLQELKYIKKALLDTPDLASGVSAEANKLEKQLLDIRQEIFGNPAVITYHESMGPNLSERINAQLAATAPITQTVQRNYDMAASRFAQLLEQLRQVVDIDLKNLEKQLEVIGAPWTPGRGVPRWQNEEEKN